MTDFALGFFAPWLVYALLLALHIVLPARRVQGYVLDRASGKPLRYRLNGPLVLVAAIGLWAASSALGLMSSDWIYLHRWAGLAGSCALGTLISLALAQGQAQTQAMPARGEASFLRAFYRGRRENPQYLKGRVDAKMYLYMSGATMLALNLLSSLAHRLSVFGLEGSSGIFLYCFLFMWFIVDYIVFERVHLYTYDFFAECLGFKLVFGCLAFYPYFYCVGLLAAADLGAPIVAPWLPTVAAALFFAGWIFSRGANLQKYLFKIKPDDALLGILKPRTIGDGEHALLCSGFWSLSRHVNYLGEILMAVGLTLALGYPALWLAWLYPLYYLALLVPRQRADERRCAAKYGALWDEYVRLVPRRIVPWLY